MTSIGQLSESLEDYVEIIFQIIEERRVARVKEIAERKGVRMTSVTSALKRLARDGLVSYTAREFVELTDRGAELGRRLAQRHEFVRRFLTDILQVESEIAEKDACGIEHHLSLVTLDRLAAFFQYIQNCPVVDRSVIERFENCCAAGLAPMKTVCQKCPSFLKQMGEEQPPAPAPVVRLGELRPGEAGHVYRLRATSPVRQRLVDMGVLPNVRIEIQSVAPLGDPIKVRIKGYRLSMRRAEADSILVEKEA